MKSSKGVVFKRQQKLLSLLKNNEIIDVAKVAEELNVSALTIRRDLDAFQERGMVERFYGGARFVQGALNEDPTFMHKENDESTLEMIAKKAADMINPYDIVFINSSSTAFRVFKHLENKTVTVVTNNGNALMLPKMPNVTIILTGGEVYERKNSMVGDYALNIFTKINATKCILGVSGINEKGITTSVLQETAVNRTMLERKLGPRIVIATGERIGREHNFLSSELPLITHLVTDKSAKSEEIEKLKNKKINVTLVGEDNV